MRRYLVSAIAILMLSALNAAAATLNFVGTGQTHSVTRNDINPAFNTEIDIITGDQKSYGNGLFLDVGAGQADVTYTFLGAEAGNSNFAAIIGGGYFFNRGGATSSPGDQVTVRQDSGGLLDFAFGSYAPLRALGAFLNHGLAYPGSSNFAMGFVQIDINSFYVLFDDIASGDRDFDDMALRIDVAAVPIPAGGLLLLSALAGALVLRRRSTTA